MAGRELLRYFAYGSNLLTAQMAERCPGASHPRPATLADHAWICNTRGVATVVPVPGRVVHGLVWEVTAAHLASLDHFEGVAARRYRRLTMPVVMDGGEVDAVIYVDSTTEPGPPRHGYLERVLGGAVEHGLPEHWLTYLRGWARAGPGPARPADPTAGPGTLTELLATDGVTETVEMRSPFGFMALHGGQLEEVTDRIATEAAELAGASSYVVHHPIGVESHLPSTRFRPDESPALAEFLAHVEVVISIHGYGRRGRWTEVMAGGRNRILAERVAHDIRHAVDGFTVVTDLDEIPDGLRGQHPDNPVNVPAQRGVQLELPPRIRGLSPLSPPAGDDGLSPPTRALIDTLATIAGAWARG